MEQTRLLPWVESRFFQRVVLALIVLAAAVVGLETDRELMASHGALLRTLDQVLVWAFALEALLKIASHGRRPWDYFRDPWNSFDFTVVALCFVPAVGPLASIARLARVLRALRIVTAVPKLQILVNSLLRALPSMGYVGFLLLLLFYVYAVAGVFLFRANDPEHFLDLPRSLVTMFRVVTLEGWTELLYIQMYGSDRIAGYAELNRSGVLPVSTAQPIVAVAFFFSFVLLGTLVVLNLVIGVILSSMQEAQAEREMQDLDARRAAGSVLSLEQELRRLEADYAALHERLGALRRRAGS